MKQYGKSLLVMGLAGFMILAMVSFTGCKTKNEVTLRVKMGQVSDLQLSQVLRKNAEAIGGFAIWDEPFEVTADVIASIKSPGGGVSLIEQNHKVVSGHDADQGVSVLVISDEAHGSLRESLNFDRKMKISMATGNDVIAIKDEVRVQGGAIKLYLEAIAMTGSIGLLKDDLALRYRGQERKGGRYQHRLEATGQLYDRSNATYKTVDDMLVVWVDVQTNLIDRIWVKYQRADKPNEFGYLAANVRKYTKLDNGLKLPQYIAFAPSDAHQQFSRNHMLIMEVKSFESN